MQRIPAIPYEQAKETTKEGEIIELAAASGLFNYFNRFNNSLKMEPAK